MVEFGSQRALRMSGALRLHSQAGDVRASVLKLTKQQARVKLTHANSNNLVLAWGLNVERRIKWKKRTEWRLALIAFVNC